MRRAPGLILPAVVLACGVGCRARTPPPSASPEPSPAAARSPLAIQTTDPKIALDNFESQLARALSAVEKSPDSPPALATASAMLLARGRLLGRITDAERGRDLAERAARLAPKSTVALRARAAVRAAFHRFDDALADLDAIEKLGDRDFTLRVDRAGVLEAMGRVDEARPLREQVAEAWPTADSLGALAALRGDEDRIAEAERLFISAQQKVSDPSPFPVVWLYFQEALLWERVGQPARACLLLEAAHAKLPMHASVESHLAGCDARSGDRNRAIDRLRALAARSDDPEHPGQLAALVREAGRVDEAERLFRETAARYQALVDSPSGSGYLDHAARFHLAWGADRKAALALAERNLALRRTVASLTLVADAALAVNDAARACRAVTDALPLAPRRVSLRALAFRAYRACGDSTRAAAMSADVERLSREK